MTGIITDGDVYSPRHARGSWLSGPGATNTLSGCPEQPWWLHL
jgi:hypothetical protein